MGLIIFVWTQIVLIPMLGGILLGMRYETRKRERHLATALKALGLIAITHKHRSPRDE